MGKLIRVWGIGTARTLRVHWMLKELGLDYETRPIITRSDDMNDADFVALTQRGKIPFLEDGDLVMGESAAIVTHLADCYRDNAQLSPVLGSDERARFEELCFFVMTEMDALLYVLRRHEGLPSVYGESQVACDASRAYFLRQAGDIERGLADGRPYLMGDAFSVPDLLLGSCLDWASFVQIELSDRLSGYRETMAARPAHQEAMTINFPPEAIAALLDSK